MKESEEKLLEELSYFAGFFAGYVAHLSKDKDLYERAKIRYNEVLTKLGLK